MWTLTARAECPHGALHVRQAKTDSAQRSLPLTPRVAEVLQRRKRAAEGKPNPSPFVFPGGRHFGAHRFHAASARKGNRGCGLGELLNSTAGVTHSEPALHSPAWTVSPWPRLMGHSSPSVAARYYIHVTETQRCRRVREICRVPDAQRSRGIERSIPASLGSGPIACFSIRGTHGGTQNVRKCP